LRDRERDAEKRRMERIREREKVIKGWGLVKIIHIQEGDSKNGARDS
jgi:hypothetical protein